MWVREWALEQWEEGSQVSLAQDLLKLKVIMPKYHQPKQVVCTALSSSEGHVGIG